MTEPKVVRRNPRFGSALPQSQWVQKYARTDPNGHIPFVEESDYILADAKDKWAALGIGIAVLIVVALDSAWLIEWLP